MSKPMIRIVELDGTVIDREMTDDEFVQHKADNEKVAKRLAETQAKAAAKEALLEKLGITEDEAKLLLS